MFIDISISYNLGELNSRTSIAYDIPKANHHQTITPLPSNIAKSTLATGQQRLLTWNKTKLTSIYGAITIKLLKNRPFPRRKGKASKTKRPRKPWPKTIALSLFIFFPFSQLFLWESDSYFNWIIVLHFLSLALSCVVNLAFPLFHYKRKMEK